MFQCPNCGTQIDENSNPQIKPITMWGYFGYELLFSIPVVGFIVMLVFAFGGGQNVNVRNFARSYFCYFIIMAILIGILVAIAGAAGLFTWFSLGF